jgi:hypothetical protein
MSTLANWFIAKLNWAKENPLFWWNIALILGTVAVSVIYPAPVIESVPSDFRLKFWGLLLQLIGVFTVWHDLAHSGQTFGKSGFFPRTWTWLKAGVLGRKVVINLESGVIAITGGKVRITQRRNTPPDSPIEQRVEALEYNLQKIDQELESVLQEIDQRTGELKAQIKGESQKLKASHSALEESLTNAIVGNYAVLAFGALWLVIGMVLSTLAPEIAKIVAGQWDVVWKVV